MRNAKKGDDRVHLQMQVEGEESVIANFSAKQGVYQTALSLELIAGTEVSFLVSGSPLAVAIFGITGNFDSDDEDYEEEEDLEDEEYEDMSLDDSALDMDSTLESPLKGKKRKALNELQSDSKKSKLQDLVADETLSDDSEDRDFSVDSSALEESSMLDDEAESSDLEEEEDLDDEEDEHDDDSDNWEHLDEKDPDDKEIMNFVKSMKKNNKGKDMREKALVNGTLKANGSSKESPKKQATPKPKQNQSVTESPKSSKKKKNQAEKSPDTKEATHATSATKEAAPATPTTQKKSKDKKRKSMAANADVSMAKSPVAAPASPKTEKKEQKSASPKTEKKEQKYADTPKLKKEQNSAGTPKLKKEQKSADTPKLKKEQKSVDTPKLKKEQKSVDTPKLKKEQKSADTPKVKSQKLGDTPKAKKDSTQSPKANGASKKEKEIRQGGVVVKDIVEGSGSEVSIGRRVRMYYKGTLTKGGKCFDSCQKGKPFSFRLGVGEVIKGWDIGIKGMKVGGKRHLSIPSHMGYGKQGAGSDIPPNASLEFDVEMVGFN